MDTPISPTQTPEASPTTAGEYDRRALRQVLDSLVLHLHPTRVPAAALRFTYTWGLGGISTLLCLILMGTGVLLMFRYQPDVEKAYLSIHALETEVAFGSLIRALHHWSANLLVVTVFLHLVRVFVTGGFKARRRTNWVIGVLLLVLVLAFNFTGYLLPWDQLAYWAITVSTSIIRYVPLVGREISKALLGGHVVGQRSLHNFYTLHVAVLPAALLTLMAYHFWRIRKDGGISQPEPAPGEKPLKVTTVPNLVRREVAVGAVVLTALVAFAMLVPAPLGSVADPLRSPNPAKAAWYFGGLQELLLHMETEAALLLLGLLFAGLLLLPQLEPAAADSGAAADSRAAADSGAAADSRAAADSGAGIGIAFRSRTGRTAALFGGLVALNAVPLLIIADEFWIDWRAWLPGWPTLISNGLVPLAAVLALIATVYLATRILLRARHSEGVVALFTFLTVALLLMTLICGVFRGENMGLTLPGWF
jgi:quinol-cytochrome oxidoreductase complex cytochrome b subunit